MLYYRSPNAGTQQPNTAIQSHFVYGAPAGTGGAIEIIQSNYGSYTLARGRWRATGSAPPANRFTRRWNTATSKHVPIAVKTVGGVQTLVLGQVTETDLARPIAIAPKRRLVGQVTETDLAQALTRQKRRLVGQVTETDLAQVMLWNPKIRRVGQVFEIDLAQPITAQLGSIVTLLNVVYAQVQVTPQLSAQHDVTQGLNSRLAVPVQADAPLEV